MKFTIDGFSQSKLVEYGLDLRDAGFLRWFVDFQATGKMKQTDVDGRIHYWIDHQHLADDLPILGLKDSNSIQKYLSRFVEKHPDILLSYTERRGTGKTFRGSMAFYAIAPNVLESLLGTPEQYDAAAHDQTTDGIVTAQPNDNHTVGQGATKRQPYASDSSTKEFKNQQQKEPGTGSTTYYVDRSRQAPAPAPIAAAQKTAPEARTRIAPPALMKPSTPPMREPKEPEVSKLSTSDYLIKLKEIAKNTGTRDLTVEEQTEAVKLGKAHGSKAVISAWEAYLERKSGRGFTLFLRDVTDFTAYKPLPNTLDDEFKQAVEHRDEILTDENDALVVDHAAAFFDKIGGRPGKQENRPFWFGTERAYHDSPQKNYAEQRQGMVDEIVEVVDELIPMPLAATA